MRVERIGDATLYLGDCLEILPTLGPVDAVVTDPPYGYAFSSGRESSHRNMQIVGDNNTECRDQVLTLLNGMPIAVFGSWKVAPPKNARTALVYDKGPASGMGDLSIPWKCSWEIIWIIGRGWSGNRDEGVLRGHSVVTWESKGRLHVNEKPVSLIAEIIKKAPGETILDPFMGSGTTGVACANLGRKFIGIEIEPKYFDIACRRIRDAYAQPRLPLEEPEAATQKELL